MNRKWIPVHFLILILLVELQEQGHFSSTRKTKRECKHSLLFSLMEPQVGLEPTTCRLQGGCSTNWAITA